MTDQELQNLVASISFRFFSKPFRHQAKFNHRLKTTGGRYFLCSHNIEINPKMLNEFNRAVLISVIKHELCHYHLHLAGMSGKHSSPEFKSLLATVGGARFSPRINDGQYYLYECYNCHQRYRRKRKINLDKFVCGKCHARLKLMAEKK